MLGVIFGFTLMVSILNFGLINVFKIYPLLQDILKVSGSVFLVYLAYKIAFSKNVDKGYKQNPVKFIETFFFQAEDGIRDRSPSRGLGDVYKRQVLM